MFSALCAQPLAFVSGRVAGTSSPVRQMLALDETTLILGFALLGLLGSAAVVLRALALAF